jgi:alpha-tubulin suppressor-like RCC1 family protein
LWAWGDGQNGQLGNGGTSNSSVPVKINSPEPGQTWVSVTGGDYHALGILSDGTLWAWGGNYYGALGLGSSVTYTDVPTQVMPGTTFSTVCAGGYHTLAISSNGTLYAWGWNVYAQVGNNPSNPYPVWTPTVIGTSNRLYRWSSLGAGYACSYAQLTERYSGAIYTYSWGSNYSGEISSSGGIGVDEVLTPQPVYWNGTTEFATFTQVSVGGFFAIALAPTSLYLPCATGDNTYGELGQGDAGTTGNAVFDCDDEFADITGPPVNTGVQSYDGAANIKVYPNPTSNNINIDYAITCDNSSAIITIYDFNSKKIAEFTDDNLSAGQHTKLINLQGLGMASGVYFLTLSTGDGAVQTQKIIYKR